MFWEHEVGLSKCLTPTILTGSSSEEERAFWEREAGISKFPSPTKFGAETYESRRGIA